MSLGVAGALGGAVVTLPAHAIPLDEQAGASHITFYSFAGDATDLRSMVSLSASAGTNIAQVAFQYKLTSAPNIPASWVDIETDTRDAAGGFHGDWTIPPALNGVPIDLRVRGTVPGVPPAPATEVLSNVETGVVAHANDGSFDELTLDETYQTGYFAAPYAAPHNGQYVGVTGTTLLNTTPTAAHVGWVDGTGALRGTVTGSPSVVNHNFSATLDLAGSYPFDSTAPVIDQIPLYAEIRGPGGRYTPDVYSSNLYRQTITTLTATPTTQDIPSSQPTAPVVVHVADQNGNAVVGAEVRSSQTGSPVRYTDATGAAMFDQNGGTTATYWANATASAPYEPGVGDKSTQATVTTTVDTSDRLVAVLADGPAFDIDEYAPGDVAVQLQDSTGTNKNAGLNQKLQYHWRIIPFDASAPLTVPVPDGSVSASLGSGKFTVPLPTDRPAGDYELWAGLTADAFGNGALPQRKVTTLKTGEATLLWNGVEPQVQASQTTATATGSLKLPDGTPLPGRTVTLTWVRGAVVAGGDQTPDSTLVGGTNNAGTSTTGTDGTFAAQVTDPAEPIPVSETGGKLTATGGVDSTSVHRIDFIADTSVPAGAKLGVTATALPANQQTDAVNGTSPGQLRAGRVQLLTAAGAALPGRNVTLTVDHGFFVDPALTGAARFNPAPSPGGDYGEWKSMGTSITVKTGADGTAPYLVSIERDTGFDDDGKVTATIAGTAGTATDSTSVEWNTINEYNATTGAGENALNIADLTLTRAPAAVQTGPVDPAPAGSAVRYDVFAHDQFGNPVAGVDTTVACVGGPQGKPCATITGSDVTDFDSAGDLSLTSQYGGVWAFTASAVYSETVWNATSTAPVASAKTVTGSANQEWYAVDWSAASYSLTHDPSGVLAPGTTVTETLVVLDQHGRPVAGAPVGFRHGTSAVTTVPTDASGTAVYSFVADKAGTDTVTATIHDPQTPANVVRTLTDEVQVKVQPEVTIISATSLDRRDKIVASSSTPAETAAAEATVYRLSGTTWVELGASTRTVGADGRVTFKPKDLNGNAKTTYKVVFAESDQSFGAESASVKVR